MPGLPQLSSGALAKILRGETVEKPVLQVLGAKKISGANYHRMRLLISDGKYFNSHAMLATQLNSLYDGEKLPEFTIIRVENHITSMVNKSDAGRRVLVILEITILVPGNEVGRKIGSPVVYVESGGDTSDQAPSKPITTNNNQMTTTKPSLSSTANNNSHNNTLNQTINAGLTHPISSLSPYQNKWVIKARVVSKSSIRTWSNAKGEGKLFSMDLMDSSGEIRATAFKEQCEKYYDMIEVDRVYYISKCQLKPANKQYSTLNNDYEMTFTSETVVQLCEEEDEIPTIKYDLMEIAKIANCEPKTAVDTIGVCKEVMELQTIVARNTNKEFKKRDLVLVDMSGASINLTLWGDDAVNFNEQHPVILVKGARVAEFNGGKSLSVGNGSVFKINPDIDECYKLRGWFDKGGGDQITNVISARTAAGNNMNAEWRTFYEARLLGNEDKPDYFKCKATIHVTKSQNAFYKACSNEDCNKKVVDQENGYYRCERCNSQSPNFKYRLLLNMSIVDWTSNRWVTCFSDVAEQLLGQSASEVGNALEKDPEKAELIFAGAHFQSYIFKLRTKMEMFGDTARSKINVQAISPVNYKEYNKYLIENLKQLTGIQKN